MHTLRLRQIRRHLGEPQAPPSPEDWQAFLAAVSDAYEQFDRDRQLLERSLELSAQDVLEANSKLRAAFDAFPDVLLRLDASGKVIDYTVGRTTQLPLREQVLGKPLRDVLRLEDATAYRCG
jgi:PAS domain-containing protein